MATVQDAINYVLACRGAPYVIWYDGQALTEGPPPWSINAPPPEPSEVIQRGLFCAGVPNLMLRVMGLPIPNPYDNTDWDGGTMAYEAYYWSVSEWFDVNKSYPDGTLLVHGYTDSSLAGQGHVSVVYQGYCIEAIVSDTSTGWPGLVWQYTPLESNAWGYYSIAVLPENWLGQPAEPSKPPSGKGTPMTVDHLLSVYTDYLSREDATSYFPHLIKAFGDWNVNNRARVAAILGHWSGETGELQYWDEIGHGDGRFGEYWGRGPGGLTWQNMYQGAQDAWNQRYPDHQVDFVNNPDLVATPEYGFWASCWAWAGAGTDSNELADAGDFARIVEIQYGGPDNYELPNNYQTRESYYEWGLSHLPADLTIGKGEDKQGDIVWSKYTLVADGQPYVDFANAAATSLRALGVDADAVFGKENISQASADISRANDGTKQNLLVVGKPAHDLLVSEAQGRDGWAKSSPIWAMWAETEADSLGKLYAWGIWWIAKYGEGVDEDRAKEDFLAILLAIDSGKYLKMVNDLRGDNPPPDPPPPSLTLEQRVAVLEKDVSEIKDKVSGE